MAVREGLYMQRCATVLSLTQLEEERAKAESPVPAPSAPPPLPAPVVSGPEAPVVHISGQPVATYLFGADVAQPRCKASLQKHHSNDDCVVPDLDKMLREQDEDEVATRPYTNGSPPPAFCVMMDKEAMVPEHSFIDQGASEVLGVVPQKSMLDSVILTLWEDCAEQGLFRYDVTACATKVVPGVYGFIAQLNEGRATMKRPTEFRVDQVIQPFDAGKFNFKKAQQREVLLAFEQSHDGRPHLLEACASPASPNLLFINVSPIEYGHVLLVPRVLDDLPQLVDPGTFGLALRFAREAGNPYLRVGFNSLGAYATINHLHFQAYYLAAPMPCERAPTAPLAGLLPLLACPASAAAKRKRCTPSACTRVRVSMLADYPVRGWVLEAPIASVPGALAELAQLVGTACVRMQAANQPHNMIVCESGCRVFLWPQCFAEKQAKGLVPQDILDTGVNPATFEISGHLVLKRKEDYEQMSQERAWTLLEQVSLDEQRFAEATALAFEGLIEGW